jgi:hypothetical protein
MASDAQWHLTVELGVALTDRWSWQHGAAEAFQAWVKFLREVHRHAPAELEGWVTRFLAAVHEARPDLAVSLMAQQLVVFALVPSEPEPATFTRAIIAALAKARPYLPEDMGDPAAAGFVAFARTVFENHQNRQAAALIIGRAWTMLPFDDQLRTRSLVFG